MSVLIIYVLKAMAIQAIWLLFFALLFRRSGWHGFNRLFLGFGFLGSFICPLVKLPSWSPETPVVGREAITWLTTPVQQLQVDLIPIQQMPTDFTGLYHGMAGLYLAITLFLLVRSIWSLAALHRLAKSSIPVYCKGIKVYKTYGHRPFSFFSKIFLPARLFLSRDFDQILAHERVHVNQLHSLDRLVLDFAVSLFWFNPFMHLFRNALIEIHEFQADEYVLKTFKDPIGYQESLYSQLSDPGYSAFVSHFNVQLIKKSNCNDEQAKETDPLGLHGRCAVGTNYTFFLFKP